MLVPTQASPSKPLGLFAKLIPAILAGIGIGNVLSESIVVLPQQWIERLGMGYLGISILLIGLPALVFVVYTTVSHWRGSAGDTGRQAVLQAVIRYWLAFEIATYGFAKILHTQFEQSFAREYMRAGDMDGFDLTWFYFSHSYLLACILGGIQILGSILLLFRRTTLLGVAVLLPVMVNIMLINLFYDIAEGAFINSVLFSVGLLYLLLTQWTALSTLFLGSPDLYLSPGRPLLGWFFRVLSIGGAFMLIFYFVQSENKPVLLGKWKVERLERKGVAVLSDAWLRDSLAWTTVYFEKGSRALFSPNPYVFDSRRATYTRYQLDTVAKKLTFITWLSETRWDTSRLDLLHYSRMHLLGKGKFGGDSVLLELKKEVED